MIFALFSWLYILFILTAYGYGGFLLLKRTFGWDEYDAISLPLLLLLGLACVNVLAAILSLFIPLGLIANIVLFIGALALAAPAWRYVRLHHHFRWPDILELSILLLALLLILENATRLPSNPDTNLYHAQAIRWIETYRAVPGLGNLHTRLAFNSNWLVLNALFSFAFLGLRSFHLLPGLIFLVSILYFFSGFVEFKRGDITISALIKAVLLPISFHIWASELSSPGTDLPTSLLIWVVLIAWIESLRQPQPEIYQSIAFVLSLTAITFKVSALPLLLLGMFWGYKNLVNKNFKVLIAMALLGILCLLPWFARNFIVSGYWIYPAPALIPLSPVVDWRIPPDTVIHELAGIQTWARQFTLKSNLDSSGFMDWFPAWFSRQTLSQRLLFLTSILLPPFFGIFSIFERRALDIVHVTAYAGVLFWFFTAPTIRFGFGFLVMTVLLMGTTLLLALFDPGKWKTFGSTIFRVAAVLYLGFMLYRSVDVSTLNRRFFLPEDYRVFPTDSCQIANAAIQCAAKYNQCGYYAFPCAVKAFPYVELRGEDWQSGFRIVQP